MGNDVILELSLRCSDLDYYNDLAAPSTMISVQYLQSSSGFWEQYAETDTVHGSAQPVFKKTIKFNMSKKVDIATQLRFLVIKLESSKLYPAIELGTCYCFIEDLMQTKRHFTFHLQKNGNYAGCMYISVLRKKTQMLPRKSKQGKKILPLDQSIAQNLRQADQQREYGSVSSEPLLRAVYHLDSVTSRSYRFPTDNGRYVKVEELMMESRLSFHIPILYLKICINELEKKISGAANIGELTGNWELIRQSKVSDQSKYLAKYRSRLQFLQQRYGPPFFKRSVDRCIENLDFVPINMHLQRMRVKDEMVDAVEPLANGSTPSSSCANLPTSQSWSDYDVITVGATAQHFMGFKHGGLLSQLASGNDGNKRQMYLTPYNFSAPHIPNRAYFEWINCKRSVEQWFSTASPHQLSCGKNNLPPNLAETCLKHTCLEEEELNIRIDQLREQIKYQIEKLRTIIKPSSSSSSSDLYRDKVTSSTEALSSLTQKVCQLTSCCETGLIARAAVTLASSRPSYKPPPKLNISPSLANGARQKTNEVIASTEVEFDVSPEAVWEDQTLQVKSILSDVVRSVHAHVAIPVDGKDNEKGAAEPSNQAEANLLSLSYLVDNLHSDSLSAIAFSSLFLSKAKVDHQLDLRRNSVFSQALSICTCGVSTIIASSLNNELKLQQFSDVGIFLQVESLISTHGNEQSMMQDYAIGILELEKVSFKCVRLSGHHPSNDATPTRRKDDGVELLPTLEGKSNQPIVILPFDDDSFQLLPVDLQRGRLIKIHPVIYNVGVNEEQSFAERFGNTALQDYLNEEALKRTLKYYDLVRDRCPLSIGGVQRNAQSILNESSLPSGNATSSDNLPLIGQLKNLDVAVHMKKNKNVEVLELAADVCRRLNGIRISSCKSAKDRTAMSVTLEQTRLLASRHSLAPSVFTEALNCMRSEGTRRENTLKNTGCRRYAFTSVQLMTFPKLYRPPDGTYGKGES